MSRGKYLKPFRTCLLACGCPVRRYDDVKYDTARSSHAAWNRRIPVICPRCGEQTYAPPNTMRKA